MKTDAAAPIGVFDSGVGGLTVARALLGLLPDESLLYFADTIHLPYGCRPPEQIRGFALAITTFLVQQGAKAVVMGCNTSSAVALESAREMHRLPIFGIIQPGAKAALHTSRRGRIGILATQATVSTRAYSRTLRSLDSSVEVIEQPCPEFVPLVERGELDSAFARQVARAYLAPLLQFGVDVLLFGCTQYPLLAPLLREIAGPQIALIDPAEEVAREVAASLRDAGLLKPPGGNPRPHRFFASGDDTSLRTVGARFLGRPIEEVQPACLWKE